MLHQQMTTQISSQSEKIDSFSVKILFNQFEFEEIRRDDSTFNETIDACME
jgi:hypothetical protein